MAQLVERGRLHDDWAGDRAFKIDDELKRRGARRHGFLHPHLSLRPHLSLDLPSSAACSSRVGSRGVLPGPCMNRQHTFTLAHVRPPMAMRTVDISTELQILPPQTRSNEFEMLAEERHQLSGPHGSGSAVKA
jgi:hypothetical protein